MAAFIKELSTNIFEALSESLIELMKEKSQIIDIRRRLNTELKDLNLRIKNDTNNILHLQNLSINAMRDTGKLKFENKKSIICWCNYNCGQRCDEQKYEVSHQVEVPILEPDYAARRVASEELPAARNELNRFLKESKLRSSKLKAEIKKKSDEIVELFRIQNILENCKNTLTLINGIGKVVEISRSDFVHLYSLLENENRVELIHLLIALDHSGNLLKKFALQLHKINPHLSEDLACHLYGMDKIGDIATESDANQFKLEVFSSKLYQNKFDRITKELMINAIKHQIQRLNNYDEWWMISSKSTTESLNRLIDLIQDPNCGHLTYNELIAQWSKETTLTNFLEEKTTRGTLINNHRNIFSLFSCSQADTKTYSFIQGLKNKFGDRLVDQNESLSKPVALKFYLHN